VEAQEKKQIMTLRTNRSIPRCTVIPEIAYPYVDQASAWLCEAFGFTVRLRIASHRVQLSVGDGAVVVKEGGAGGSSQGSLLHSVLIRVANVDAHHEHAKQQGARIVRPPADYPFGERQYTAEDFAGRSWTFSQTIADVAPEEWGGTSVQL
jgi:uncharacterized glyoxalase superfamily protein PhnB